MDDGIMRKVARNRETVKLVSGDRVTLICWGSMGGGQRARVQFPNGRQRTVRQAEIVSVEDL
jgi:hypothetical protein